MLKISENKGTEEFGLVTPTLEQGIRVRDLAHGGETT